MSLSTHVLDTALGRPAAHLAITLARLDGTSWTTLATTETDADGRCPNLLPGPTPPATYRLHFSTEPYFAALNLPSLFPFVEITVTVRDDRHHHIPLLLTANGYTTYRGS